MKTGYRIFFLISLLFLTGFALSAQGNTDDFKQSLDYAQVLDVKIRQTGDAWTFSVTVRHNDEGWDHYADIWQVLHPETGEVLGERVLLHPHDTEQPFTRSQSDSNSEECNGSYCPGRMHCPWVRRERAVYTTL